MGEDREQAEMAKPVKKKTRLVLGLMCALLAAIGIAVLALSLTVWRGGGEAENDPESLAAVFLAALRDGNAAALIDCWSPKMVQEILSDPSNFSRESYIDVMNAMLELMDFEYSGLEFETRLEGEDRARVRLVGGRFQATFFESTYRPDLTQAPIIFEMVLKDGRWYIDNDPLAEMDSILFYGEGFDLGSDLAELDIWSGAEYPDPEPLVRAYMDAYEEKDARTCVGCIDPEYYGDDVKAMGPEGFLAVFDTAMDLMDIDFIDVELSTDRREETTARITAASGTVAFSVLGRSGEVDLSSQPLVFDLFKKGDRWYLWDDPLNALFVAAEVWE